MKNRKNNTLIYIMLGLILGIGTLFAVKSTLALFSSSARVTNTQTAGKYGMTFQRSWESTKWEPGETKVPTELNIRNDGEVAMAVRVTIAEQFFKSTGEEITNIDGLVTKNINTDNWYYRNGYYYYKNILNGGATTPNIINSITFSSEITNDSECHENPEDATQIICGNTGLGFEDSTYRLIINWEL